MYQNNEITSRIEKGQNNKWHHFLYVFGVKESDEIVILVIRGQLLPQRSPRGHHSSYAVSYIKHS